jgi:hypothetical protein
MLGYCQNQARMNLPAQPSMLQAPEQESGVPDGNNGCAAGSHGGSSPDSDMKAGMRGFGWIGWLLAPIVMFFVVAGIGYLRERHDERIEQERIRPMARELTERVDKVEMGDPLEKVLLLFPEAFWDRNFNGDTRDLVVPGLLSSGSHCFSIDSGKVVYYSERPVKAGPTDWFPPGPWYYFLRAWGIQPRGDTHEQMPTTLDEAHAGMERNLQDWGLAKIDAIKAEDELGGQRFGEGFGIWDRQGLWHDTPLTKHMQALGFTRPDDMAKVILATLWCKRHDQPYRLKERAAEYAAYWEAARKMVDEDGRRVGSAKLKMRSMMMGIRFNTKGPPAVRMPDRTINSIRARFLAPYRGGVFIAALENGGSYADDFSTAPYFYSSADGMIHKVRVPELEGIDSAVVAGQTCWCAGVSVGAGALIGITADRRIMVPLPKKGKAPQLGLHGQSLLAVYPKSVYELADDSWKMLYAGDAPLPRAGPPPQLNGGLLCLRDEGHCGSQKRLWFLTTGNEPKLVSLDQDTGVVVPQGPRWEDSFSHAVTGSGDLWTCVGGTHDRYSLLRRLKDGTYSIAIMNNSVGFTPDLLGSKDVDQGISVSAVSVLHDDTLLLIGNSGLYRLKGRDLFQNLAFTNTKQQIPFDDGKKALYWDWDPCEVLVLGDDSYFISGEFGGIYMLKKDKGGKWEFKSLDEALGEPVTW